MKSFFMNKEYDDYDENESNIFGSINEPIKYKNNLNIPVSIINVDLGKKVILENEIKEFIEAKSEELKATNVNLFQLLYFRCFDKKLKDYLLSQGFSYDWIMD